MTHWLQEPPPTAGLPLSWRDFVKGSASLEHDLATFTGQIDAQIECSGTAAILVALTTLKRMSIRRNVVIPAYTCPLVPLAILRCGLKPVLCDTKPNHFDLCPESLKAVCDEETLAVISTHLGGRVADIKSTTDIATQVGAYVVEDAAQALGANWQGQAVGTVGDIGCFSLGVGKGLTIYGGGAVVARDKNMRHQLRTTSAELASSKSTWHHIMWEARRLLELAGYYALYRPSGLKLAFGLALRRNLKKNKFIEAAGDDCSADFPLHRVGLLRKTIGASALKRLPDFIANTSKQALRRKSLLSNIPGIIVMDDNIGDVGTWPYFLVLMPTQATRDLALSKLWAARLGVGRLFIHALADYPYLTSAFDSSDTPNASDFAARTLTISNSLWLNEDDFMHICIVLEQSVA
ncbi:L-glutamine:2-deoxy-scyllo-inosose aminotransferase [mine drainage metagenome]|uniref:L-glutamine:2-deoxy-scyllo-inosose aminotransferase n=1 Tax=mine drainage metagenome TaxID=410659 RepID=A0A1J5SKD5_9ZZZZ